MKSSTRQAISNAILETLESRQLMSAAVLEGDTLVLRGDAHTANRMTLQLVDSQTLAADVNGTMTEFDLRRVRSVHVIGGDKGDYVSLQPSLRIDARVETDGGNDTILTAAGNDWIDSGDGNDLVRAGSGGDVVLSKNGNNRLFGGRGADRLVGGAGDDLLSGGRGRDRIDGGGGNNRLRGSTTGDAIRNVGQPVDAPPPVTPPPVTPPDTAVGGDNPDPVIPPDDGSNNPGDPSTDPTPGDDTDRQTPVITLIADTIQQGHAIHAHALESDFNGASQLETRYDWDFGDEGSEFNTLSGWNVAHAYEKPGAYTVTLRMTDPAGNVTVSTRTITVAAESRREIYVAANGNDSANGLTPQTAVRSFERASDLVDDNTAILFRRGDTFKVYGPMSINGTNVVVGAYGTGNNPVLSQQDDAFKMMISVWVTARDITVRDITFDSPFLPVNGYAEKSAIRGVTTGGTNVSIRDCVALNITDLVNSEREPHGLLVQDNKAPLVDGLRGYLVWGDGSDHVYVGNEVANSTREHAMRMNGVTRLNVSHNRLSNLNRQSGPNRDPDDISKGTIEVHKGSWAYISGNEVWDGPIRVGPRAAITEERNSAHDYSVIENNIVHDKVIQLKAGAHHVMIRNNVVETTLTENPIHVHRTDYAGRSTYDVTIEHNTVINLSDTGKFMNLEGNGSGFRIRNNLFLAPSLRYGWSNSSGIYVGNADASALVEVSGNIWSTPTRYEGRAVGGGMFFVGPTWETGSYMTLAQWEALPQVSSEQVVDVQLADGSYQFTSNGVTAGSTLARAA